MKLGTHREDAPEAQLARLVLECVLAFLLLGGICALLLWPDALP